MLCRFSESYQYIYFKSYSVHNFSTYSFRGLKSPISKTDKSEPSHTLINYESKDSDMVESNTETGTSNASFVTKKKLKTPTPFSGKREDLRKFLQEDKIYLLVNSGIYTSDLDKILFVLSYMTEGDANSWKEEFYDTAEQKAAQDGLTILLGAYKELMDLIIKDFSPYDAPKDAIYEMKEMKIGNASIDEHVAKFKMLVTKLKLEKNEAVVEYFRETIPLQRNIMNLEKPLTTLNKWYEWAIKLHNNFVHMKDAIAKSQKRGGNAPPTLNKKSNEKGP